MKKKLLSVLLVVALFFVLGMSAQLQAKISDLRLYVNGSQINSDVVLINGKSYLPLRVVADAVGLEVVYDGTNRRIDLNSSEQVVDDAAPEPDESTPPVENNRKNPAKIGEGWRLYIDSWIDGEAVIDMVMTEIISGDEAWRLLEDANMFNNPPEDGKEYILAKFKVTVVSTEDDKPFELSQFSFDTVSEEGVVYDSDFAIGPDPAFRTDVYAGATHEGWVPFYVNSSDNPVAVYDRGQDWSLWFSLR